MSILRVLQNVKIKKIRKILLLGAWHPLFIAPTLRATKKCLNVSTELYGKSHHQNGPANAFRHAFWNYLIAKKCFSWRPNQKRVMLWTEKITDWHEAAFPNSSLARAMDLHNNAVGRQLFLGHRSESVEHVIDKLKNLTLKSVQIHSESDIIVQPLQLVHIIDMK